MVVSVPRRFPVREAVDRQVPGQHRRIPDAGRFPPFLPARRRRAHRREPGNTRPSKGNARFLNDCNLGIAEELIAFAAFCGHSLLELAFSWLLSHRQVASVIAGATNPEQVHGNVHAAGWHLDHAELAEIDKLAPMEAS